MQPEIYKLKLYINFKWFVLLATAGMLALESLLGVISMVAIISAYIALFIAALLNLWLIELIRRGQTPSFAAHFSLSMDLGLMILGLYFNGGLENTWLFFPAIVIFIAGYLFTLRSSIMYALSSFVAFFLMFLLEHFQIIPHFRAYNLPEAYWLNLEYCIDYLGGLLLLFFVAAFGSGYLNQLMRNKSDQLEQSLKESDQALIELRKSRLAMLNVVEDLDRAKNELELRVRERTAELEEAKQSLEKRVAERTVDLENARKAILHMLSDLKEDMVKMRALDELKTEFISTVSHELRTPLTAIKEGITVVMDGLGGATTADQQEYLGIARNNVDRLHRIINKVLDFSKLEAHKMPFHMQPADLVAVIKETVVSHKSLAEGKGISIVTKIDPALPKLNIDADRIAQVLMNLLDNAVKFTSKGGIVVSATKDEHHQVVKVCVGDTGRGIADEDLPRLFKRFEQVGGESQRTTGGTGLGLAICKEIIKNHNGEIWAESELGKGSRFYFSLPLIPKN